MTFTGYPIYPLRFNSQCITFEEWVSLFTLCLAPLFVHIFSGTPNNISYLTEHRPKWYQRMCHYNPTSILWRYAAITDRRIRALEWSKIDIAASNAIFWTAQGWDGSEYMVHLSTPLCTHLPPRNRTELMSITTLKTIIITAQGLSAIYKIVRNAAGEAFLSPLSLDTVFFPLAVLSLLRVFAAAWLTDNYGYMLRDEIETMPLPPVTKASNFGKSELADTVHLVTTNNTTEWSRSRFKPSSFWLSWAFRILYTLILLGFSLVALVCLIPGTINANGYTTTVFLSILFYFVFLTVTLVTLTFFFVNGSITTTIIPCIDSVWYRLYTVLLGATTVALIIIASIETNRMPTGNYSSIHLDMGAAKCVSTSLFPLPLVPGSSILGIFSNTTMDAYFEGGNSNTLWAGLELNNTLGDRFWAYNFNGYCIGVPLNTTTVGN